MKMSQKVQANKHFFFLLLHITGMPSFGFEHHQNTLFNFRPWYMITTLCPEVIHRSRIELER